MSTKGMTRVSCIQCPKCKDMIYSRARHDYHECDCGDVTIDGGFDYMHVSWKNKHPKTIIRYVKATRMELHGDWNYSINKFGKIKEEQ